MLILFALTLPHEAAEFKSCILTFLTKEMFKAIFANSILKKVPHHVIMASPLLNNRVFFALSKVLFKKILF